MSTQIHWRSIEQQLQTFRTIWLNTTRRDGHAHSVPICFWWENDGKHKRVYFITDSNAAKTQNLGFNPNVTLHTSEGDDAIVLTGSATLIQDEHERQRISIGCRSKYLDLYRWDILPVLHRHQIVFCVDITQVRVWRYSHGMSATDWHFEVPQPENPFSEERLPVV